MKKYMKILLVVVSIIIIVSISFGIPYYQRYRNYKNMVNAINIPSISLQNIENGTYIGEYDVDFISAKVEIVIKNHVIEDITLIEHNNDRGEKANIIIDNILEEQKIDIDVITGATASSKVIQQAIVNALTNI